MTHPARELSSSMLPDLSDVSGLPAVASVAARGALITLADVLGSAVPDDGTFAATVRLAPLGLPAAGAPAGFTVLSQGVPEVEVWGQSADLVQPAGTAEAQRVAAPIFSAPVTNPFGLTSVGFFASPAFADIDGDGDVDAFIGDIYGNTQFFRNNGDASTPDFSAEGTNPFGLRDVGRYASPTFVDIDGDGDLDAAVGDYSGNTVIYRNTGTANLPDFSGEALFGFSNSTASARPSFADIDGDGDLDAVVGKIFSSVQVFLNVGSASVPAFAVSGSDFGLSTSDRLVSYTFADIDGDGDLDAFAGQFYGGTQFFRNTGSATVPTFSAEEGNFGLSDVGSAADPTLVDIDGDGDLDAFIGANDGVVSFFENEPAGVTIALSGGSTAVTEGGATDSYTVVLRTAPTHDVTITLDDTNGQVGGSSTTLVFTPGNWNVAQTVTVTAVNDQVGEGGHTGVIGHSVSSTDPSYDGLAVSPVRVLVTDDDLPEADPSFGVGVTNPFGLTDVGYYARPNFVDIDGDGDLDAFVGERFGSTLFFRNTGSANAPAFTIESSALGSTGFYSANPSFADIDGDGDLDAFVGSSSEDTQFFRNTGSASDPVFTAEGLDVGLTDIGNYASPTFADIDGDGDLDAFAGSSSDVMQFYRNTGSASAPAFTAEVGNFGLTAVGAFARPTLADIDCDGDLDAFVGSNTGETLFFRNTGSASAPAFTAESSNFGVTDVGAYASPALADLDADGDFDAFVGFSDGNLRFFVNNSSFAVQAPKAIKFTDSAFDDSFVTVSRSLVSRGAESTALTHGISGGTDNGSTVSKTSSYGVLTVTKAGGAYSFVPNDAAIEALGATASTSFTITVSSGALTQSLTLTVNLAQSGTTETAGHDTLAGTSGANRMDGLAGNDSLSGGGGNDTLSGGDGKDTLSGGDSVDTLRGGKGSDRLDGGNGVDSLTGGSGNDRYVVNNGGDLISETATAAGEIDSVSSIITWTLGANLEKLTLTGSKAIAGHGNGLANTITGNAGNNLLSGAGGKDTLTGGDGLDSFRFSSAINGSTNIDRLTDFDPADDRIQLENSVFTKLTTTGALKSANFKASTSGNAADSNDFVLYETDTGKLFYDLDGNGAAAKMLIATLTGVPVLTSGDIFVT